METFRPIVFYLALAGFALLLGLSICTWEGIEPPVNIPYGLLFAIMFPIWAFTIFYLKKTRETDEEAKSTDKGFGERIKLLLGNPPSWVLTLLGLVYAYGLYSLYLWMTGGAMNPVQVGEGIYQINNHGAISTYNEAQYQVMHHKHLVASYGFIMVFYAVAAAALAPWDGQRA